MARIPSRKAKDDLIRLLGVYEWGREELREALEGVVDADVLRGLPRDRSLPKELRLGVAHLAQEKQLTNEPVILAIEAKIPDEAQQLARLRVDLEIVDPPEGLLDSAELAEIKRAATRAHLHDDSIYAKMKRELAVGARKASSLSTSVGNSDQVSAWFDAANREIVELGDEPLLVGLLELAVKHGAEPGKRQLREHLNALRLREPSDPRESELSAEDRGALEKIVNRYGIMVPAADFLDLQQRCLARVALIKVGGSGVGTGFLVGDDLLMTAFHVLGDVINGSQTASDVEIVFDYCGRRRDAQPGPSTGLYLQGADEDNPRPWLIDGLPPTDEEANEVDVPLSTPISVDFIDFALLRLDAAVGAQHGPDGLREYFRLNPAAERRALTSGTALMVVGHPIDPRTHRSAPQMISIEPNAFDGVNPTRTRVRYRTNTRSGSSGSPVLTLGGDVVAVHHYGRRRRYNQGVPISAILERSVVAAALGG